MFNKPRIALLALATTIAMGGSSFGRDAARPMSADERQEIEQIIREYLLKNPEILRDASAELDRRSEEAQKVAQSRALVEARANLVSERGSTILGNRNGKVSLIVFFDYNCPFCRASVGDLDALAKSNPDLKIILREFPVLGPQSTDASRVALAAARQLVLPDVRAKYYQAMMSVKGTMDGELASSMGEKFGVDRSRLQKDLHDKDLDKMINENILLAERLGINGVPSFVVGNQIVVGAVGADKLQSAIALAAE